jgi:hypothetical protein
MLLYILRTLCSTGQANTKVESMAQLQVNLFTYSPILLQLLQAWMGNKDQLGSSSILHQTNELQESMAYMCVQSTNFARHKALAEC